MHMQRIFKFLICLTFAVLANANSSIKKENTIKEPKVKVETIRIIQPLKPSPISSSTPFDNSFMPVFLTSNVKTNDFTQEMLKSLATNNFIKPITNPSVKSVNKSNKQLPNKDISKKIESKAIKSEAIVTRWSKAGSTNSNFAPVLPINLSKMHFDTTGFIPIVPKQSTRSSSNAKLVKQVKNKPVSRPTVNAKSVPLSNMTQQKGLVSSLAKNTSKRKPLIDLNKQFNKQINNLPNPSVRAINPIKSNLKSISSSTAIKPQKAVKSTPSKNAKIVDNRGIIASSSTELNSYINSQLSSREARKALLKMNTLRYLAKLSPQWAASSLSETYQPSKTGGGMLNAYPIGKITIPSDQDSYGGGYKKKPELSIELIKEILHKLTNDDLRFNKLYVMGTHRPKNQEDEGSYQPEVSSGYQDNGIYQPDNNLNQEKKPDGYQTDSKTENGDYNQPDQGGYNQPDQAGYNEPDQTGYNQQDQAGYNQPDQAGYNQPDQGGYNQPDQGGYNQPDQAGYNQPDQGGYNQPEQGGYSQPDYSQPGENSYGNGINSNEMGNSYSNQGNSYNSDNANSYQNGGDADQEQGYHLQSLGYDMSQYTNRAYVPAYSLNSLASFVHSKFKETAMKKQMGEYQFMDNPYLNNYEDYKSMDVNYAQYMPSGKKKCSKNMNGGQNARGYANNDVNFDDSYNNYVKVIKLVPGVNIDFKK